MVRAVGGVDGERCQYRADFSYFERTTNGWRFVVEDCKGYRTDLYEWKRRHMKAQYGIDVKET